MSINKFFYRFGHKNQNALLAVTHNSLESVEMIEYLIKNFNFNKYFLELNKANALFIIKNSFFHSEFYPILKKQHNNNNKNTSNSYKKIKLIDVSIEAEVKILTKIKTNFSNKRKINFLDEYISFSFSKYVFYKIWHFEEIKVGDIIISFNEVIKQMDFYQSHILYRELVILCKIKRDILVNYDKNKEKNMKKYFGKYYELLLKEANINLNTESIKYYYDADCENDENKNLQYKNKNNENLIVTGQYHFDNLLKNNLL
jgi:hypothetical protein